MFYYLEIILETIIEPLMLLLDSISDILLTLNYFSIEEYSYFFGMIFIIFLERLA